MTSQALSSVKMNYKLNEMNVLYSMVRGQQVRPLFWEQRRTEDERLWMENHIHMLHQSGEHDDGK